MRLSIGGCRGYVGGGGSSIGTGRALRPTITIPIPAGGPTDRRGIRSLILWGTRRGLNTGRESRVNRGSRHLAIRILRNLFIGAWGLSLWTMGLIIRTGRLPILPYMLLVVGT